jgi:hypothetical protein
MPPRSRSRRACRGRPCSTRRAAAYDNGARSGDGTSRAWLCLARARSAAGSRSASHAPTVRRR